MKSKKSNIVWLAYYHGKIFQKFRPKERFVNDIVTKFKVSKWAIVFEITLRRLIEEYPKIENSSLSLHYFKKHLKLFKEIFKESASKFKYFFFFFFSTVLFYFVWGINCAVFANRFLSLVRLLKLILSNCLWVSLNNICKIFK